MLKQYLWSLLLLITFVFPSEATVFSKTSNHALLTVAPEYISLSPQNKNLEFIARLNIKPGWHVYWQNPGDTGDPTSLNYFDYPYYNIEKTTLSTPLKQTFNEMITTYIHRQEMYIKTNISLNDLNNITNLPFNLVLDFTVCKEECYPEKIKLNFNLPITENADKNPDFMPIRISSDSSFPLPLNTSAITQKDQAQLQVNDDILKECDQPEFISSHLKKSILADLPRTIVADKNHLRITFDEGEFPSDLSGILLCNHFAYEINPTIKDASSTPSENQTAGLLYYLLTAFIAGLILNLMPCVLPILSLKALYLAQHKDQASPLSACVYLIGVLTSFLVLSGLLFYLRGLGTEFGWGFQLQSPSFNIFLLILFFLIFLNLIDKLQIPASFADKLHKISGNKSFLTGFFAVLVACPCTGPFMGAALGYAMKESAPIYFGIFLSLGLGYALPYVLIEMFPRFFLKFIPKPGKWMITLKRILALPIALTCLWLGWVTYNQLRPLPANHELLWESYDPQKIEQAINAKEPVLIDFTAKWCLIK